MGFSKLKSAEALRIAESLLFLCHCNTQAFQADWASSAESIWSQGPAPKHRYTKELPTFWPKFCQGQLNLFSHQCYPLCLNPFPPLFHVTLPLPYSQAAIPSPLPCAPAASLQSKPAFSLRMGFLFPPERPLALLHCPPPALWQKAFVWHLTSVSPEPCRMAVIHCHN